MNQALLERYRCPRQFLGNRTNSISSRTGVLRAGADAAHQDGTAVDLADDVRGWDSQYSCIATEVIDYLRRERYTAAGCASPGALSAAKRLYYLIRPLLPTPVRRQLQRIYLRNWAEIPFPRWPLDVTVEELLEQRLLALLKTTGTPIPFIWFWPHGALSAAMVTHDVETTSGRNFCDRLMDINESFRIPSSFQIVPEERYKITSTFLDGIRSRGNEINVQDLNHDGRLFHNRVEFESRVKRINQYGREFGAKGFRSAVLYRNPDWFDQLEFEYDMSVPNVGHMDAQRGGCCTVFPYFIGDLLELPVTMAQDYTMFHMFRRYDLTLWNTQGAMIAGKHGLLSLIVHPDYVQDSRPQDTYRRLLASLDQRRQEQGMWIATPGEINHWWRQRSRLTLTRHHGRWRIDGPGRERARLAYAKLEGDNLVYAIGN